MTLLFSLNPHFCHEKYQNWPIIILFLISHYILQNLMSHGTFFLQTLFLSWQISELTNHNSFCISHYILQHKCPMTPFFFLFLFMIWQISELTNHNSLCFSHFTSPTSPSHNTFFPTSPFLPSLWHPRSSLSIPIMTFFGSFFLYVIHSNKTEQVTPTFFFFEIDN